jgi:predicted flap endonuclease-1-like 5' DNA nuclease
LKDNNFWVVDRCKRGEFFKDDPVSFIPGIGANMKERLEAKGIFMVWTLAALSNDSINHLMARPDFKL